MKFLKNLPIEYKGELHDIHLVNFTVDPSEVEPYLPKPLKLRLFKGRAMISMVDVSLRKMHPKSLPGVFSFNYQHVAFRLLVDDAEYNPDGQAKGIFFLRSFTRKPLIATGGQLTTHYNLEKARMRNLPRGVEVKADDETVRYHLLGPTFNPGAKRELREIVEKIDRAYHVEEGEVFKTQIMRKKWPLIPMDVYSFKNTFFKTARLEGVFKVPEVIHYRWLPPQKVEKCA